MIGRIGKQGGGRGVGWEWQMGRVVARHWGRVPFPCLCFGQVAVQAHRSSLGTFYKTPEVSVQVGHIAISADYGNVAIRALLISMITCKTKKKHTEGRTHSKVSGISTLFLLFPGAVSSA